MTSFAIGARRRGIWMGAAVFLVAMALVAAAFRLAHNERQFELDRWTARLQADGAQPLRMVNGWLMESRAALRNVAVNPTVQIYLSQTALGAASPATPESEAQSAFLQSYVASLGGRSPFAASFNKSQSETGLAVLDAQHHVVAVTPGYRPSPQRITSLAAQLSNGEAGPLALQTPDGALVGFLTAVRPIQGMLSAPPVGYVIAERRLDRNFWPAGGSLLAADQGHESLVANGPDRAISLVGSSLTSHKPLADSGELQAARAPGQLQHKADLTGEDALSLGLPVQATNWVLVETVPTSQALAGVEARISNLLVILLLSLLAIILGVLLLWRHMTALQQAAARESGLKLYRGVAEALLQAIDLRDPGAAEHSRRVGSLSRQIAVRIGSSAIEADTAELAGALMNVGKLFVPVRVLTKSGALEEAEASQFAEGTERWLELLAHSPLDPPLEPVLRDAYRIGRGELIDSSAVGLNTYIIVAANMTVALRSPRAYRMAHTPEDALRILKAQKPRIPQKVFSAVSEIVASKE